MRGPLPVAVGGNAMALLSKEFLNQYKDRPAHMTPLGLFILICAKVIDTKKEIL